MAGYGSGVKSKSKPKGKTKRAKKQKVQKGVTKARGVHKFLLGK